MIFPHHFDAKIRKDTGQACYPARVIL